MTGPVILEGPIPSTGVVPIIQAVGIGRQVSALRVFDGPKLLGQLWIKAGKVLAVEFGESEGAEALRRLVTQREGSFSVSTETLSPLPEPLGDLREMLAETGASHTQVSLLRIPARTPIGETGVQAMPVLGSDDAPVERPEPAPSAPAPISVPSRRFAPVPAAPISPAVSPFSRAPSSPPPAPSPLPSRSRPSAPSFEPAPAEPVASAPTLQASSAPPPLPRSLTRPVQVPAQRPAAPPVKPVERKLTFDVAPMLASTSGSSAPVVALVSPKGGVGKTTISLNLAVALARRGLRVTLVDADPNGGVSATVNALDRRTTGAFDVVSGVMSLDDVLIVSRMSSLRVVPAGGAVLSIEQLERAQSDGRGWEQLIARASRDSDVVLVDTPAGTLGPTRVLFGAVTHVLGVLQAEPVAMRVAAQLDRALSASAPAPRVLGFVVNMFDSRSAASASVIQEACRALPAGQMFETPIPRTNVINDAALRGVVPAQADLATAPAIAWAFDQLAAEVLARLDVERPGAVLESAPLF